MTMMNHYTQTLKEKKKNIQLMIEKKDKESLIKIKKKTKG